MADDVTKKTTDDEVEGDEVLDEEKEIGDVDDIDPAKISTDDTTDDVDDVEEPTEEAEVVSPEDDPFGFGGFGALNEDGEFVAPAVDDDEEEEDEVSEDLF